MSDRRADATATTLTLAVIGGDGIGPEVVAEGLKVLRAAAATKGIDIATTEYDLGARRWHATGETLPASVLEEVRGVDAIYLGAIGDPTVPSGVLERGVLLPLRFALDHFVNLRPAKLYPGVASPLDVARVAPDGIDVGVGREGTEGPVSFTQLIVYKRRGPLRVRRQGPRRPHGRLRDPARDRCRDRRGHRVGVVHGGQPLSRSPTARDPGYSPNRRSGLR